MTGTKERPILFSGPMVRAILGGLKTQTRRAVKPQPTHRLIEGAGHVTIGMDPVNDGSVWYDADCINPGREVRCPYGRVGDRLWVRETHQWSFPSDAFTTESEMVKEGWAAREGRRPLHSVLHYRATDTLPLIIDPDGNEVGWRPSIHMPRWASRITLEITDVRVERVQDISEADAIAEGCPGENCYRPPGYTSLVTDDGMLPQEQFRDLWDSINAARGFGWNTNPWVWVVSFKRIDRRDNARHQKAAC